MCGKFTQMYSYRQVWEYYNFFASAAIEDKIETVMPMRFASIIRLNDKGAREVERMRWGFSKIHATAPGAKPDHIHARGETVDVKPTFRESFEQRRGLLVVRTFNEGKEIAQGKTEQHTITPKDGKPIAIAVLWEAWEHQSGETLYTFVMVTTEPNPLIATITDRMPAIIKPDDWGLWLGENGASSADAKALLRTFDGEWDMQPEKLRKKPDENQPGLF